MKKTSWTALALCLGLLSACGGGGGEASTGSDGEAGTFSEYRASVAAAASPVSAPASAPLAGAVAIEAVQLQSRQWAVTTLLANPTLSSSGSYFSGNQVVMPPLHFARVQMLAAGAYGATLKQLTDAQPMAANSALALALSRGVTRSVSGVAQTPVTTGFMRALTAADRPDTWAALSLNELTSSEQAVSPNLRLSVDDSLNTRLAWPAAFYFDGVFDSGGGERRRAAMLRVSGLGFQLSREGARVDGLQLPGGRWLLRVEPEASIHHFSAAQLEAALSAAVTRALQAPGDATTVVLPSSAVFDALGLYGQGGMSLAFDPKLADLRGIDGQGGLYASAWVGSVSIGLDNSGLSLRGLLSTHFIYNPENVNAGAGGGAAGGWQSYSGGSYFYGMPPYTPPCGNTDLRPAYMALVDERGAVQMLARWTQPGGTSCPP